MARTNMNRIVAIIHACVDDQRMLAHGSGMVDARRSGVLWRIAEERRHSIGELRLAARTLGGTPSARGTLLGAACRRVLDVRAFVGGPHAGDVIAACRRSQERLESHFARVAAEEWSNPIVQVLDEEYDAVRDARAVLIGLQ